MKKNPTYNDSDIGYLDDDFSEKEVKNDKISNTELDPSKLDSEKNETQDESKEV